MIIWELVEVAKVSHAVDISSPVWTGLLADEFHKWCCDLARGRVFRGAICGCFFLHWNLSSGHAWWKLPSWLLTYLMCTIPDIANTLHSLEHAIRPRLLPTVTAINREVFALFLHFTIPNTHTDEPQTFNPSSPQHSNFNPSRTLNSRTNYMETTNPTTIQQIQKGYSRIRRSGDTYP